jgi:methylglyoxal synthase
MIIDNYINIPIPKQKRIALIAHDHKKEELVEWVKANIKILRKHFLCGTGTTARIIAEETELPVRAYNSGPLGGDQQIGSRIVEGNIDVVIFFWDPLEAQPHDPDVKALLRIAAVYDIPIANNRASADFIISSPLMDIQYDRKIINYNRNMMQRVKQFQDDNIHDNLI